MARIASGLTMALATAGLIALPLVASARSSGNPQAQPPATQPTQTTPTTQPPPTTEPTQTTQPAPTAQPAQTTQPTQTQQPVPTPPTAQGTAGAAPAGTQMSPQSQLDEASRALESINAASLTGDAAARVAAVRNEFNDLRAAYGTGAPTSPGAPDWHAKYTALDKDLGDLAGGSVAPTVRAAVQDFRTHVQTFYASTLGRPGSQMPGAATTGTSIPSANPGAPPAAAAPAPSSDNGAGALLDRITDVIDQSLGHSPANPDGAKSGTPGAKGTTGVLPGVSSKSAAGKVSVDRAALDEIRAEVEQLKIMLRQRQKNP